MVPWVGLWSVMMAYFGDKVNSVLSGHSKRRPKFGFQYRVSLNAGQKYCRMREHSAILSTFIKLPFSNKAFVLSICMLLLKTGFTVLTFFLHVLQAWEKLSKNLLIINYWADSNII